MNTVSLTPWERRLADLGQVLQGCHESYFTPDLFRRNTNHFLQTSRTVTFIIQKHKTSIPDFDAWYKKNVTGAWADDPVMTWAKESRNQIEKEGDLETRSSLRLSLFFSYLEEQDRHVDLGRSELLTASVKFLVRLARKWLPTGVEDGAAVRIERRWVANSLSEWELLKAMRHVYGRVYAACESLAEHLGGKISPRIVRPADVHVAAEMAQQVAYLKLSNLELHRLSTERHRISRDEAVPAEAQRVLDKVRQEKVERHDFDSTVSYMTSMAEATFNEYGNHIPMLFIFDDKWHPIEVASTNFADQTDKYIFWRRVGEFVKVTGAAGLSWTSESWLRSLDGHQQVPTRKLRILGEMLHNIVIDKSGRRHETVWAIERAGGDAKPTLKCAVEEAELHVPTFLAPVTRAFGLPDHPSLTKY
jgi:hypothetical protein